MLRMRSQILKLLFVQPQVLATSMPGTICGESIPEYDFLSNEKESAR
jgi:hypothetical protein